VRTARTRYLTRFLPAMAGHFMPSGLAGQQARGAAGPGLREVPLPLLAVSVLARVSRSRSR
jgi:hypothetical protein